MEQMIYTFEAKTIDGKIVNFEKYKGKVLLVVNTATECGFTKQFGGLQTLYDTYNDKGLEILAFPCNQFANQEPRKEEEISQFCKSNYGVSFQMFSKIDVNGKNAHPLFKYLAKELPGMLNMKFLKWNFTKFLIDSKGTPIERFSPSTSPEKLAIHIEKLLKSNK